MAEHLSGERLSALLDDTPTAEERRHLEACPGCEGELRRLRRMRMALSALDDFEAPDDGWARLEAAFSDREGAPAGAEAGREAPGPAEPAADRRGARSGWSLAGAGARAAAAVVLFAGGMALGTHLSGPEGGTGTTARAGDAGAAEPSAGERVAVEGTARSGPPAGEAPDVRTEESARATAVGGLAEGTYPPAVDGASDEVYRDPAAAAERLARLDAVMQAAREAVREDPSDPAVNDLLFRVAEDRRALVEALHLATLEYR